MLECLNWKENSGSWGLIHGVYEKEPVEGYHKGTNMEELGIKRGEYVITKQYYALCQFKRCIKPGYTIIDSDNDNVVIAASPNGSEIVVISLNNSEEHQNYELCFNGPVELDDVQLYRISDTEKLTKLEGISLKQGKYLNIVLPKRSLNTFILKNKVTRGAWKTIF